MSGKVRASVLVLGLLVVAMASSAYACLWDNDTLQMERMRFPAAQEIITGKFVRHTPAYYEWRITDRKQKLAAKPDDPAQLDDLAVAYGKLGRSEEGIALLELTLARRPDRYETLSNLGTLLFFVGRLDESKDYIRRALEVNPNAHFGRERYQLLLTEYLQQSDHKASGVMSRSPRQPRADYLSGFARYVIGMAFGDGELLKDDSDRVAMETPEHLAELQRATKAVLGMMHFADHQSPVLLEALGDLLLAGELEENTTQLAARAYLRASQVSSDPKAAEAYRRMADNALSTHVDFSEESKERLANLKAQLARELKTADQWYATIESRERQWIAEGADVDAAFAAVYYDSLDQTIAAAEQQLQSEPVDWRLSMNEAFRREQNKRVFIIVTVFFAFLSLPFVRMLWRRKRRAS